MCGEFNGVIYFILQPPKMGGTEVKPPKIEYYYISSDCNKILRDYYLMSGEFNGIINFILQPPKWGYFIIILRPTRNGGPGIKSPKIEKLLHFIRFKLNFKALLFDVW